MILDNLEHLLAEQLPLNESNHDEVTHDEVNKGGAGVVQALLERVLSLSILCTSRRRLGLRGEQVVPVAPLPVPPLVATADNLEALAHSPSVRLYLDRARLIRPDFALTQTNASAVAALCHQLEGSPLALELAAAWVRTLPPRKMWERLAAGLDIPAGSYRDLPARQRNLSAALEWSWRLLPPDQQRLWARLAVFRGGWTVEAATAISSLPNTSALLVHLGEASLLTIHENEAGEMRYGFLETVRAFGEAKLRETPSEYAEIAGSHADYYVALAEAAKPELSGPAQLKWLECLEADHDNLRSALAWHSAYSDDESRVGGKSLKMAARLATALGEFWGARGYWEEVQRWFSLCLVHPDADRLSQVLRARLLNGAAIVAKLQGDLPKAKLLYDEGLSLSRQLGDPAIIGAMLHNLGTLAIDQGDLAQAQALFEENLAIFREIGNLPSVADMLTHLGITAQELGDVVRAQSFYEESLPLWRSLGDECELSFTLNGFGNLMCSQGEFAQAEALLGESLAIRRRLRNRQDIALTLSGLSRLRRQQHDYSEAKVLLAECLTLHRQLGDRLNVTVALEEWALLALATKETERTGRLFGAAASLRLLLGHPPLPADKIIHQQVLDEFVHGPEAAIFAASQVQGGTLTWEQAIDELEL